MVVYVLLSLFRDINSMLNTSLKEQSALVGQTVFPPPSTDIFTETSEYMIDEPRRTRTKHHHASTSSFRKRPRLMHNTIKALNPHMARASDLPAFLDYAPDAITYNGGRLHKDYDSIIDVGVLDGVYSLSFLGVCVCVCKLM